MNKMMYLPPSGATTACGNRKFLTGSNTGVGRTGGNNYTTLPKHHSTGQYSQQQPYGAAGSRPSGTAVNTAGGKRRKPVDISFLKNGRAGINPRTAHGGRSVSKNKTAGGVQHGAQANQEAQSS